MFSRKNTNLVLKYPVFINFIFFLYTAKCLKAKKIILCFSYTKKQCFSMHFGFNNQFIIVKRTLTKISKTTKILFCLSFSIWGTTLHVIRISDIKFFLFGR